MYNLTIQNTLADFIEKYLQRGFGSMNKNDFEVFIFKQLLSDSNYQRKSNYELSLKLHIPETKIKRLRYEAALCTQNTADDYKKEVRKLLKNAQFREDNNKIAFQVEDIMLQKYIISILKKEGRPIDSSFNSELLVFHFEDLQYLIEEVYSKEEVDDLIRKTQQLIISQKKKIEQFKDYPAIKQHIEIIINQNNKNNKDLLSRIFKILKILREIGMLSGNLTTNGIGEQLKNFIQSIIEKFS